MYAVIIALLVFIALQYCLYAILAAWGFSRIDSQLETLMNANERLIEALKKIDTATDNIAADIRALKVKIETGGPTEEILASLEDAVTRLEGIAAETPDQDPA